MSAGCPQPSQLVPLIPPFPNILRAGGRQSLSPQQIPRQKRRVGCGSEPRLSDRSRSGALCASRAEGFTEGFITRGQRAAVP